MRSSEHKHNVKAACEGGLFLKLRFFLRTRSGGSSK
jgi:hypothetical protein